MVIVIQEEEEIMDSRIGGSELNIDLNSFCTETLLCNFSSAISFLIKHCITLSIKASESSLLYGHRDVVDHFHEKYFRKKSHRRLFR